MVGSSLRKLTGNSLFRIDFDLSDLISDLASIYNSERHPVFKNSCMDCLRENIIMSDMTSGHVIWTFIGFNGA